MHPSRSQTRARSKCSLKRQKSYGCGLGQDENEPKLIRILGILAWRMGHRLVSFRGQRKRRQTHEVYRLKIWSVVESASSQIREENTRAKLHRVPSQGGDDAISFREARDHW